MTNSLGKLEREVHDYVILNREINCGNNGPNYQLSSNIFEILQGARNGTKDGFLSRVARFFRLADQDMNVPAYFVILGFNPNDAGHQKYVSGNASNSYQGRKLNSLSLEERTDVAERGTLVLDEYGRIVYIDPKINIAGVNGDQHKNGIEISKYLKGCCVYTMNNGIIKRYEDGKITFSTKEEDLKRIMNRMPLPDVRAITGGMEHPSDVVLPLQAGYDSLNSYYGTSSLSAA